MNKIIPGYDPSDFDKYDNLDQIRNRLEALDPLTDSIYELAHLNMEAARIIRISKPEFWESAIDRLTHTLNKEIYSAATYSVNNGRINSFKEAIKHMKLDILVI